MLQKANPGAASTATGAEDAQSGRTTRLQHSDETALAEALRLSAAGIPVFPCGSNKAPLTPHGFKNATCDEPRIRRWWANAPNALIGTPTGSASGLWAADADVDKSTGECVGENTLARLGLGKYSHRCATPSGGSHLFFRWRPGLPRCSAKKMPGVDVRGDGGYVIAWNPDAMLAAKNDMNLPAPPLVLLSALASSSRTQAQTGMRLDRSGSTSSGNHLEQALARIRAANKGSRRDTLNSASFSVGLTLHLAAVEEPAIRLLLIDAGLSTGLPEWEVLRTVDNALADAKRRSLVPTLPVASPVTNRHPFPGGRREQA
jgi:hypothetical protein